MTLVPDEAFWRSTVQDVRFGGDRLIVGYTILALLDLAVDRETNTVVTNPKHPHGPVFRV